MEKVRAIFLSDVHLGTRSCQADKLLDFLRQHESDYLYLVGDIIDFWAMSRSLYWSPEQNTVVQKILKRARHGVRVVFIPGNHDEALCEYVGASFGGIRVARAPVHCAADGRRYLLVHGDQFDQVTRYHRWLALIGDHGYALMVSINVWLSRCRRRLGLAGHWSLSAYIKHNLKRAIDYIHEFESAVARYAGEHGFDGIICGHIHAPAHKEVDGVTYLNCGDWVDSCTALVEYADGRFALLAWDTLPLPRPATATPAPVTPLAAAGGKTSTGAARSQRKPLADSRR